MAQRGRRGEGTIIKLPSGRWRVRVPFKDRPPVYRVCRTQREAQTVKRALLDLKQPPQRMTVASWLAQWLEQGRRDWAPGTHALRTQRVRAYFEDIGKHQLADLSATHVQRLQETLLKTLAPSTTANIMGALSAALSEAERMGLVEENVAKRVRKPRAGRRRVLSLPAADLATVLAATDGHWLEPIAGLGLLCLMRMGEVLGLRWQDVDLDAEMVHVRGQLQRVNGAVVWRETKTVKSERLIGMPPRVVRLLTARREAQAEQRQQARVWQMSDFIFTNRTGGPLHPSTVREAWRRTLGRAGLAHMRFQDLRHAGTSHYLEQGEQVRVVMELLGHSDPRLTMGVYAHVHAEQVKRAASRIDRVIGG